MKTNFLKCVIMCAGSGKRYKKSYPKQTEIIEVCGRQFAEVGLPRISGELYKVLLDFIFVLY